MRLSSGLWILGAVIDMRTALAAMETAFDALAFRRLIRTLHGPAAIAFAMARKGGSKPGTREEAESTDLRKGRRKGATHAPHDALFRALLSDPVQAQTRLRDHLPNRIVALLADKPPKSSPEVSWTKACGGSQLDLLMEAETVAGRPAFAYALVEHQCRKNPDAERFPHPNMSQRAGATIHITDIVIAAKRKIRPQKPR